MGMERDNTVQSVERAMQILEKLADYRYGTGISQISKDTGLHKSTIHRLLATLIKDGYVERTIDNENYRLGIRLLHIASRVLDRIDVRTTSGPYIRRLAELTGEVVHLSILQGNRAIYIDKVESTNTNSSIRMTSQVGKSIPLHCTAAGKVFLSNLNEQDVRMRIKEEDMEKFTGSTIVSIDLLIEELKRVKLNGYAIDDMEFEEGIRCVSAPIFDREGEVAAALSISGITTHMNNERMSKMIKDILLVSFEISVQLGYTPR